MKFELKTIKFIEEMSEETNCFYAKLYINKKFVADVRNDGQGGCTWVQGFDKESIERLAEAEKYLSQQPKKKCDVYDYEYFRTIESEVDDLFAEWLNIQETKKLQKKMEKGILYGNKYAYTIISWNVPLKAMLMTDKGKEIIRNKIIQLRVEQQTILNTNIPQELFN